MPTGTPGVADRQDPRQVGNTLKKTVNWNDNPANVAAAFANYLPANAFIYIVQTEIVVAFNGTTPTVNVGVNSPSYNNIVLSADLTIGTPGVYASTRGYGRSLTAGGPVLPFVLYNATGSPSTGQAIITIVFEGGWQS
jgi:hypothetical protein